MIPSGIPQQNILIIPFNTFTMSYTKYLDDIVNHGIQDVSYFKSYIQFKLRPYSDNVIFQASTDNGLIALGGTSGTITLTIPPSVTANLKLLFQRGEYDWVIVDNYGVNKTIQRGIVEVDPGAVTIITTT